MRAILSSLVVASLALAFLAGCAGSPESRPADDREATLIVESTRNGTLYVDGIERARVSAGEPRAIRVSPGPHAVSIAPTKGAESFQRVTVVAGSSQRLAFDFQDGAGGGAGEAPDTGAAAESGPGHDAGPDGTSDPDGDAEPKDAPGSEGDAGGASGTTAGRRNHTLDPASAESSLESPGGVGRDADTNAPSGTMVVRTPQGTYDGDVRNGIPHGAGTMEWEDGAVYTGEWADGRPHGSGEYRWPDGARYIGQWRDGRRHGVGSMQWADGTYYEGTWEEGQPEGTGFMEWRDGTTYEGELAAGRPDGVGTYTAPDGLRYEGEFARGRAVGGILTVPSGQQYWATMTPEGEWVRERPL